MFSAAVSYMEEAERVADRIAVIDHGRIVAQGTAAALRQETGGRTLEDAFIALTGHNIREAEAAPIDRMRPLRLRTVTTTLIRASRSTRIRAMRHPTPGLRRPLLPLAMSPQLPSAPASGAPEPDNKWPDGLA